MDWQTVAFVAAAVLFFILWLFILPRMGMG